VMREGPLYYEDLELGHVHRTGGRTIAEADVHLFAGLSGDFNSLHVDEEYASESPFKHRIAHGLLILSITSGLTTRLPIMYAIQPSLLGMLETRASFRAPVFIGDTIHVEFEITDKRLTSKGDRGVVTEVRRTINQSGQIVLESEWRVLVACRPSPPEQSE
jgi:acyl dehydratase